MNGRAHEHSATVDIGTAVLASATDALVREPNDRSVGSAPLPDIPCKTIVSQLLTVRFTPVGSTTTVSA
jgi:hypothetical protein